MALTTQSPLNVYCDVFVTNSRGQGVKDRGKTTFEFQNTYTEYTNNYNTQVDNESINTNLNSTPLPNHKFNANSRDSFGTTNDFDINQTYYNTPQINYNTPQFINNLPTSTIPPIINRNLNPSTVSTGESFNANLFDLMTKNAQHENLVYSPFSLQTILAFISMMSTGKLYEELLHLLAIPNDRLFVAERFEEILNKSSLNSPPTTLIMANKLYYDYRFGPINPNVRNLAKKSYASELEQIDFFASKKSANTINSWISGRTRNLIQDIVTPSSISGDTSALLVNSLYFKSEWLKKFDPYDTKSQDFFIARQTKIPVDMMFNEDVFRYADFPDLQASVVELPYKTMNLSMLLILPKDVEGLADLESKLRYQDFSTISDRLKRELVTVKLPRFKIEFEVDMIRPLKVVST